MVRELFAAGTAATPRNGTVAKARIAKARIAKARVADAGIADAGVANAGAAAALKSGKALAGPLSAAISARQGAMKLTVTGKQLDVGDAFRTHIADRLQTALDKYFGNAIEVAVTVAREGQRYRATIAAHVGRHIELFAESEAHDPYPAFDAAAEHLAKRLRRHKRRLRDHNKPQAADESAPLPAQSYVLKPEQDGEELHDGVDLPQGDAPPIVAETATRIASLTVGEAVMRLDLSREPALMFRNRAHGGLNMVYRRTDGTIGWVDPRDERGGRA